MNPKTKKIFKMILIAAAVIAGVIYTLNKGFDINVISSLLELIANA